MDGGAAPGPEEFEALRGALAPAEARADVAEAELAVARAKASDDQAQIAHLKLQIAKLAAPAVRADSGSMAASAATPYVRARQPAITVVSGRLMNLAASREPRTRPSGTETSLRPIEVTYFVAEAGVDGWRLLRVGHINNLVEKSWTAPLPEVRAAYPVAKFLLRLNVSRSIRQAEAADLAPLVG